MTSQRFRILSILGLLAFGVVALAGGVLYASATASTPKKQLYRCPMHPQTLLDHPGKCPICGMNLVPATVKATLPSCGIQEGGTGGCCGGDTTPQPSK